jgi:hypothetical protein
MQLSQWLWPIWFDAQIRVAWCQGQGGNDVYLLSRAQWRTPEGWSTRFLPDHFCNASPDLHPTYSKNILSMTPQNTVWLATTEIACCKPPRLPRWIQSKPRAGHPISIMTVGNGLQQGESLWNEVQSPGTKRSTMERMKATKVDRIQDANQWKGYLRSNQLQSDAFTYA